MQHHNRRHMVDNDFFKLFDQLEINAPTPSPSETDARYALVLEKAGLMKRRAQTARKAVLIAAAVMTCFLAVAATYYSVTDLFRGVLQEQSASGEVVQITTMKPVVERAGTLTDDIVISEDVSVALRGVVGDANGFKIILDITDPSGGLSLPQGMADYRFRRIQIEPLRETEEIYGFSFGSSEKVLAQSPEKISLLIDLSTQGLKTGAGDRYQLSLTDLRQRTVLPGTDIGMQPGNLYDIVSAYNPVSDSDFEIAGGEDRDGDGIYEIKSYELITDTARHMPLSEKLSGYDVTNAALRDGIVYLRGIGIGEAETEKLFGQPPALMNPKTGEVLAFSGAGWNDTAWTLSFEGVSSLEELRDYVLMTDYGEGLYTVAEGNWTFDLAFDTANTSITKTLDLPFDLNGVSFNADSLTISPFYMHLDTTVVEDTARKMAREDWFQISQWSMERDQAERFATLQMKDGSEIRVAVGGESIGEEQYSLQFSFDVVIDPTQVARVIMENLVIPFS